MKLARPTDGYYDDLSFTFLFKTIMDCRENVTITLSPSEGKRIFEKLLQAQRFIESKEANCE